MPRMSIRQLLQEMPATSGTVCYEGTGWVRVTVVADDGTVYVVDAKKENVHRTTSTEQVS